MVLGSVSQTHDILQDGRWPRGVRHNSSTPPRPKNKKGGFMLTTPAGLDQYFRLTTPGSSDQWFRLAIPEFQVPTLNVFNWMEPWSQLPSMSFSIRFLLVLFLGDRPDGKQFPQPIDTRKTTEFTRVLPTFNPPFPRLGLRYPHALGAGAGATQTQRSHFLFLFLW